jgi:NADH:ubiquinone oxidoreductase subunit 5 (subunit L)/multisubunit Na+/H+ antiporter MnhA subunit
VTLVVLGCASGLFGITFALPQRDLKRLLAYSSIENVGIITIGLGLGTIGWSVASPALALLGYGGAILHVWNHACMKSGLFFVAGAVAHSTGTRDLEKMGGLLARMPKTGALASVLVVAIVGLPPLNGFVSELVLYMASVSGIRLTDPGAFLPSLAAFGALAGIGGLSAFVFAKAFGIAFLGVPRSEQAHGAHESRSLLVPILIAVALSFLLAALGALVMTMMTRVLGRELGLSAALDSQRHALTTVALAGFALIGLSAILLLVRRALLRRREVRTAVTWDCGYAEPTARMQYTAASFAEPATTLLQPVLRMNDEVRTPQGIFPASASYVTGPTILLRDAVYGRAFAWIASGLGRLRRLQHGHVHLYVLYVALTLLALLVWRLA